MTMRSAQGEDRYTQAKKDKDLKSILDEESLKDYRFWRIVVNRFPHDKIADVNHMIVCKRKTTIDKLQGFELLELFSIIHEVQNGYDCVLMNLPSMSSVPDIPHVHLYKLKTEYR